MEIKLPNLEVNNFSRVGISNSVKHILEINQKSDCQFVSSHRSYTIIKQNNIEYCLTCNINKIPPNYTHVLLTNKKASEARLESKDYKIKKWIKHPKLKKYTTSEVRISWNNNFKFIEENVTEGIKGLRNPQIAALYSILSHIKVSDEIGTVVMPTGTGKTETMLSTLIADKCDKILITVPSDALRTQIYNKFLTLGLLRSFGIVSNEALNPKVGVLKENFKIKEDLDQFLNEANVVITTMNILSNNTHEQLSHLSNSFSHIFIDEAHHTEATSWKKIRSHFINKKVLQFTATPFRNDRKNLEGKIIFNFSLKKAQEQGYFKHINFLPIREYDLDKGDELIASIAVAKLRSDISEGRNHILMARCANKTRAKEIFKYYQSFEDLNPVMIHSSTKNKKNILKSIVNCKHRIIVAVNMLGEGFDLPQLKIAAFHDIRKSLPITLQFAGRFTRTSKDQELGNATFIANLADSKVEDELSELYAQNSDWNSLLSTLSSDQIDEKLDFDEFIQGFQHISNSKIPFQNIRFAMSTVVFKNNSSSFDLMKFSKGISKYEEFEYRFSDYNPSKKTLISITAEKGEIEWVKYKDVYGLNWKLLVLFYDETNKLLFIHSSDKSSLYSGIAKAILDDNHELISGLNIYKSFSNVKRVSLRNVGLKEFLNRKIRFRMTVGTDIEEALSIAEQQRGEKAFVFGSGYEDGKKITLGCSYKGRVWSHLKGNLKEFISWSNNLGTKLIDQNIDANQILKQTLIPKIVDSIPTKHPTHIDWDENLYNFYEHKISIISGDVTSNLSSCSLNLVDQNQLGCIKFELVTPLTSIKFQKELFINTDGESPYPDYRITKLSTESIQIKFGSKIIEIAEYLNDYVPQIWFADGSSLKGVEYVELKHTILPYPTDRLLVLDWSGVSLRKEAQGVSPIQTDSIQFKVIQYLHNGNYDIIYDDDGSGEIADLITIKEESELVKVQFYHLKYAKNGTISERIDNFYEVCGQAQKSIIWKHKTGIEFFEHLLRRKTKKYQGSEKTRIEKGTESDLERLMRIAKNKKPMEFEIFIVQPGMSKQKTTSAIMTLLGVTENYLKEVGDINLNVIVSD